MNLTPHDIVVEYKDDHGIETVTFPKSEDVARVEQDEEYVEMINHENGIDVPMYDVAFGEVYGTPDFLDPETYYIVSEPVFDAVKRMYDECDWRQFIVPNTGPTENGAVRDVNGQIIAVRSFIRHVH